MSPRIVALAALIALTSVGCGEGGSPAGTLDEAEDHADHTDLMNNFVPGDPAFERDTALNVENISRNGDRRSHTRSKNCLSCHQENGPGRGIFTFAGSLVDEELRPYPNAILRLYRTAQAPDGGPVQFGGPVELSDLAMEIEVDANGNFFTTEAPPTGFPDAPLYPQFFSESDEPLYKPDGKLHAIMGGGVTVGGCNFCHGASFPIIGRNTPADDGAP